MALMMLLWLGWDAVLSHLSLPPLIVDVAAAGVWVLEQR
jgi:hypothetical protein